ncbi:GGDEF domain-containing protein [Labrys wisconsinensis]|uniref:diguanylate cyclase n=1 Tax=Labrys wisconsinensis TaxID=425677 RepID=A0ABU0J759_9HYPH|nr:GGDEF domain-containing protein [Labrys wisconsinensis]MDQ0469022.1 diguanylate cyclase [Labrys wisconsinensis]
MAKGRELERTIAFGEQAIGHIKTHRTAAYPRIYELWYTYAAGHDSALNQALDALIHRGAIDEQDLDKLYDRHLSPARFSDRIDEVGSRLSTEIDEVVAIVESATGQAAGYGHELRTALCRLAAPPIEQAALQVVLDGLVRMTRELEASNRALEARLRDSRSEIKALQDGLRAVRTESLTDPLTSLSNRKAFDATLAGCIATARATGEPLSLLITDIDHFKRFNDNFGHLTGDQVLRLVALAVKQGIKGCDLAARYGGEEFAVILPGASLHAAVTAAEQIRRTVMSKELVKRSTGETLGRITISIGVATFQPTDSSASLIDRADACLYAAKRGGRNRVIGEPAPELGISAVA